MVWMHPILKIDLGLCSMFRFRIWTQMLTGEKFNLEPEISAVVLLRRASCPSIRRRASSRNHRAAEYPKSILAANGKQGVGAPSVSPIADDRSCSRMAERRHEEELVR
jgi:hypothetical protein